VYQWQVNKNGEKQPQCGNDENINKISIINIKAEVMSMKESMK